MVNPVWITIEGIEGVGKTYLGQRLAERLSRSENGNCRLVSEVTDSPVTAVTGQVITALLSRGDLFLRTGHPLTETLALLALKVREYENLTRATAPSDRDGAAAVESVAGGTTAGALVLEDRGVETVAIYQAAILAAGNDLAAGRVPTSREVWDELDSVAALISGTAARWRPPPTHVLLLIDDVDTCIRRFETRIGRPVAPDENALIRTAAVMYGRLAGARPELVTVIDRAGRDERQTLRELEQVCQRVLRASTMQEEPPCAM